MSDDRDSSHPNNHLRRAALRDPSQRIVPTVDQILAGLSDQPGSDEDKLSFAEAVIVLVRIGKADFDPETGLIELIAPANSPLN